MTTLPAGALEDATARRRLLLIAALGLTGLSMRTSVTSVGAVLQDLQRGLHASAGLAGLITTLPVLCFAGVGALTPRLARRFGAHSLLVVSLAVTTAGLVARAAAGTAWLFAVLSVFALTGGAVSNVLLPSLVKRHFPDRIGPMTAVYTTALAVGTTAAAGLTVPLGQLGSGWRLGLGSWGLLAAFAVVPWLPTLRGDRAAALEDGSAGPRLSMAALAHSRTAWALTIFFAVQSMQAYIAFGWFARFLNDHGISSGTAGWMVAVLSAVGIPVSVIAPRVAPSRHRALVGLFGVCFLVAYLGLAVAPVGGAWVWMVLTGVGGGMFPLSLTMIGLRSRTSASTAALSAFMQAIGYVVAGLGPLLFGALFGATGSWTLPLAVLFVTLVVSVAAGWWACAEHYVDDELAASAS